MTYTVPRALIKRHKKNLPVRAVHKFSSRALESHTTLQTVLQHAEGTKKERKTNNRGHIMKCLLTELGRKKICGSRPSFKTLLSSVLLS